MKLFSILLFTLFSQQLMASSCSCITKEYTKQYQKNARDWYGTSAHFSCRYDCTNTKGARSMIEGFHRKTIIGEELGNEIVCDGTIYKEMHSEADRWAYWSYEGNEAFNPTQSKSPTLREWAKSQGCP